MDRELGESLFNSKVVKLIVYCTPGAHFDYHPEIQNAVGHTLPSSTAHTYR